VTNFLFFGNFGIDFLFHLFFLYRYARSLEEGSFRRRTSDFFFMLLFGALFLIVRAHAPRAHNQPSATQHPLLPPASALAGWLRACVPGGPLSGRCGGVP
jgi:hypothetical protein